MGAGLKLIKNYEVLVLFVGEEGDTNKCLNQSCAPKRCPSCVFLSSPRLTSAQQSWSLVHLRSLLSDLRPVPLLSVPVGVRQWRRSVFPQKPDKRRASSPLALRNAVKGETGGQGSEANAVLPLTAARTAVVIQTRQQQQ